MRLFKNDHYACSVNPPGANQSTAFAALPEGNTSLGLLVLSIFAWTCLTQTFSLAILGYLSMIIGFAQIVRRSTRNKYWLQLFLTTSIATVIIIALFTSLQSDFMLAGLAGLLGGIDVIRRRAKKVNQQLKESIWFGKSNMHLLGLASFALLIILNWNDQGNMYSLIIGTIIGWLSGYIAPLKGGCKLHHSPTCRIAVQSMDWSITDGDQIGSLRIDNFDYQEDVLLQELPSYGRNNIKTSKIKVLLAKDKQLARMRLANGELTTFELPNCS